LDKTEKKADKSVKAKPFEGVDFKRWQRRMKF